MIFTSYLRSLPSPEVTMVPLRLPELCTSRSGAGPTGRAGPCSHCRCEAGSRFVLSPIAHRHRCAVPLPRPLLLPGGVCVRLSPGTWLLDHTVRVALTIHFFEASFSRLLERLRLHKSKDPNESLLWASLPCRGWCLAHENKELLDE